METRPRPAASLGAVAALAVIVLTASLVAHTPVTSPYTYNEDVFPIVRGRCGMCHHENGPTPMSLLTYKDALPWKESIREQLTTARMPPWGVDPAGPVVKGGHPISAREIDRIVTWASGGAPEGDASKAPAPIAPQEAWPAGPPDLELGMDRPHTVPPGQVDDTYDAVLPTTFPATKWIRAADLRPGTTSMVRDADISVEHGAVLAAWTPGLGAIESPAGAAFKLPPGASIHLRIHYRKHYLDEQRAVSDRSVVGLYFADAAASSKEIRTVAVDGRGTTPSGGLTMTLPSAVRVVAVRPVLDRSYGSVTVNATTPDGRTLPILWLTHVGPGWPRRFWLAAPIVLPAGSRVSVRVTPPAFETGARPPSSASPPLQVTLDYVSP